MTQIDYERVNNAKIEYLHIVFEYHFPNCTAYIADNYLRRLTPEQKEANRQAARRVAWQILERAAAEGRLPAASN